MIKRMNKVTSLLVAAAAIASIIPATGVNAADYKRIESKDGTIYSAIAYKDGKFLVDGNIKDGDTEATYFLKDGKYTELEDVDTGSEFGIYGSKYSTIDTDDYYVDLETGKVTDDDLISDSKDEIALTLRKKIKNVADDRYTDHDVLRSENEIKELPGSKFNELWYSTSYKLTSGSAVVYTDAKGSYIDANYNLGNLKVEVSNGTNTESVKLSNTEDSEKTGLTADNKISAKIADGAKVIGQDSKYIYRIATINLTVEGTDTIKSVNGVEVTEGTTASVEVIQKISKAQASGDIDGAKYANSVVNYQVTNDKGAAITLANDLNTANYSVVGGKLVSYEDNSVQTIELKSRAGIYYLDLAKANTDNTTALEVDVDGNLWKLEKGFVYKFDNDEDWEKVYKVDGAMEKLSVYDKNNMVVWNEKDEVYSLIGSKSSEEDKEENITTGWVETAAGNGVWNYINADGTKATGWLNLNGTWYYLDPATGVMQTGWVNVNGTWYYLNPVSNGSKGAMQTGWIKDGATWYYCNGSGAMQTGWLNLSGTWYYLQSNGAMKTGWLNDNGTWYYLYSSGAMAANTTIDGYRLGANGAWIR